MQGTVHCTKKNEYPYNDSPILLDQRSEKKKLVSAGGDPASRAEGISTFSPDKSNGDVCASSNQQSDLRDKREINI